MTLPRRRGKFLSVLRRRDEAEDGAACSFGTPCVSEQFTSHVSNQNIKYKQLIWNFALLEHNEDDHGSGCDAEVLILALPGLGIVPLVHQKG